MIVDDNGEVLRVVRRTNPNSKWDWYSLGGRWDGFLRTKNGKNVNHARIGDIDIEALEREAVSGAEERYDRIAKVINGRTWKTWAEVTTGAETGEDYSQARETYHSQDVIKDVSE